MEKANKYNGKCVTCPNISFDNSSGNCRFRCNFHCTEIFNPSDAGCEYSELSTEEIREVA